MKTRLKELLLDEKFISLTLSKQRRKSQNISKATLRPLQLDFKGEPSDEETSNSCNFCHKSIFQLEIIEGNQVFHRNFTDELVIDEIIDLILKFFKEVNIFRKDKDVQILVNKIDKPRFTEKAPTKNKLSLSHNKIKNYVIPDGVPCDFLIYLGVMNRHGKVLKNHYNKFRQINRFLEIVRDALSEIDLDSFNTRSIKIIDFGCGKAYLTFAIYYMLHIQMKLPVNIIGLDLKSKVIDFCNATAKELKYSGLEFKLGDIATYEDTNCDMVVSLHACDTATDYALINAVNWNSKIILSVPCCQHELFSQIKNSDLDPVLKYGIAKDKFTEILTNGLRGLKLEEKGYKVAMTEFTSLEHTAKNVVIRAVKKGFQNSKAKAIAKENYDNLIKKYNVSPTIGKLK